MNVDPVDFIEEFFPEIVKCSQKLTESKVVNQILCEFNYGILYCYVEVVQLKLGICGYIATDLSFNFI